MQDKYKIIHLTFDYELFLGQKTGSVRNCLIKPTDWLIELLNAHNAKASFFIDATYLLILEKNLHIDAVKEDYISIKRQLERLISDGHRIELHLHPQWLDAEWIEGQWKFKSYRFYRITSLPEPEIINLFESGKAILEKIANNISSSYKVRAFRAGGWCIQPFEKIRNAFDRTNITIDSSVVPLMKITGDIHNFDFSDAPSDLPSWRFNTDPARPERYGKYTEIPITIFRKSAIDIISLKLEKLFAKKEITKQEGSYINFPSSSVKFFQKFKKLIMGSQTWLTLEGLSEKQIKLAFAKTKKKAKITFLSHPKGISYNDIKYADKLLKMYSDDGFAFLPI